MFRLLGLVMLMALGSAAYGDEAGYRINSKNDNLLVYNFADRDIYVEFYTYFFSDRQYYSHTTSGIYRKPEYFPDEGRVIYSVIVPAGKNVEFSKYRVSGSSTVAVWWSEDGDYETDLERLRKDFNSQISGGVTDLAYNVWEAFHFDKRKTLREKTVQKVGFEVKSDGGWMVFWGPDHWIDIGEIDTTLVDPSKADFILYRDDHFGGDKFSIGINEVSSLDDYGDFDNRTSSIRIIHGHWKFYTGDKFKSDHVRLGKGSYLADEIGLHENSISSLKKD